MPHMYRRQELRIYWGHLVACLALLFLSATYWVVLELAISHKQITELASFLHDLPGNSLLSNISRPLSSCLGHTRWAEADPTKQTAGSLGHVYHV